MDGRRLGRTPLPFERRVLFWDSIRGHGSIRVAAEAAGVSLITGQKWFAERGGVKPVRDYGRRTRSLNFAEREQIGLLRATGLGVRSIARELGRDPSTISRELRRLPRGRKYKPSGYLASAAQAHADRLARRPKPAKLATDLRLRREVQDRLVKHHSPEQISRRLREDFPHDPEMWVSHETIYQALYVQGRGALKRELARHLRTGRTLRKPHRKGQRRGRIPGMVMISERPAEVADRAVPGHWEGDLIIGANGGSAVGTLVERTTRFVMLLHLPHGRGAEQVQEAMVAKMATLPEQLRQSLTWDQGIEMANHVQIAAATGMEIYFCDPRSPWQRGSNENTNGLLRQYLPKSQDLSFYGPELLDNIAAELNARPRKTLGWRTPAEGLDELLSGQPGPHGVATTS
jgi:IS30 family transposase